MIFIHSKMKILKKRKNIENVNKIFSLLLIVKMRIKIRNSNLLIRFVINHSICIYVSLLKRIVNFTKKNCQNEGKF